MENPQVRVLVELAPFDNRLRQGMQGNASLRSWASEYIQYGFQSARSGHWADGNVMRDAGRYAIIFPEVKDVVMEYSSDLVVLFGQAHSEMKNLGARFVDPFQFYRALLQFFPESRERIVQELKEKKVEEKIFKFLHGSTQHKLPYEVIKVAAEGILLFPNRATEIKEAYSSQWGVLRAYLRKAKDPVGQSDVLFAASLVGAEEARITSEGKLEVRLQEKTPSVTPPLPARPTL